ncbi:unnamed protein product [Nesidiocoris tenuis]|uniref:K Homology domain-containing protein n=1 Tax=Nesidiocoris tenuis TaxID=355587 RepID=A0A6H5FYN0_9HEMI|nr:unnamed protein product [Nesidiocoris tenuis]
MTASTDVEQKKVLKRTHKSEEMDVEEVNGIQGQVKSDSGNSKKQRLNTDAVEFRKVPVPRHRYSPLKENWMKIYSPIVEHMKLQIRFNLRTRNVEIRSGPETEDIGHVQKAAEFVKAFTYGFDVEDALALLRLENLFVETFEIKDVKTLKGDHMSRAVGRLAGKGGRTKFTVENVTKTRIVLADTKIHILGSYQNIQVAMRAICDLILGSPPSKVYGQLRNVANRMGGRL